MDGYWSSALTHSPTPPPPTSAQDGHTLKHASDALKADEDVAAAACAKNGRTLEYVDEELKGNKRVVMAAVKQVRGLWRIEPRVGCEPSKPGRM